MSRPLKQGLDYFPHDTDASGDEKIQALMALHGTSGYAFYFIMLEKVFRTENARITIGSDAIKAGFAKIMGISLKQFKAILDTALDIGCFDKELYLSSGIISSNGVQKRLHKVTELRLKERERKENLKEKGKKKYKEKEKAKTGKPTENSESGLEEHSTKINTQTFIAKYCESFKALYGKNPVITQKDSGIAVRLINIPDIENIMERFFTSKDKFITENGHSLNIIESQINKLIASTNKKSGIQTWVEKKEAQQNAEH
jgi:hypothetical protein